MLGYDRGTHVALWQTMETIKAERLASVTGGLDLQKAGSWVQQRGYDASEGWSMFKATSKIDDFHPANQSTFAEYNALRQMHGRDALPNAPIAPAAQ